MGWGKEKEKRKSQPSWSLNHWLSAWETCALTTEVIVCGAMVFSPSHQSAAVNEVSNLTIQITEYGSYKII